MRGATIAAGWAVLALACVVPLSCERAAVEFLGPPSWLGIGAVGLGLVVGFGVLAVRWGWPRTLLLAGGAALLTLIHWVIVEADPARLTWQREVYLAILSGQHDPPHQYRPLPYGFVRLLEWVTRSWILSCLVYRCIFTLGFLAASVKLAEKFLLSSRIPLVLVAIFLYYPLSILCYRGQLTDPISHALFVLGMVYIVEDRPWSLAVALFLGILAKETAVVLIPAWLACYWRGWKGWGIAFTLGLVSVTAFLAARVPFGWRPGLTAMNGAGLMIGTNLGIGEPIALSSIPLWVNYLHPALFFEPFIPSLWKLECDPRQDFRLKALSLVIPALLLLTTLAFGWLYESRNYMPAIPLMTTAALVGPRRSPTSQPSSFI